MFKILVTSDQHCGCFFGLTPPSWMIERSRAPKVRALQEKAWKWHMEDLKSVGKIDLLVCNGDAIDGKQHKSGSCHLLTADLDEQVEIAREALSAPKAGELAFTLGTPYHTDASGQHYERQLARTFGAQAEEELVIKHAGRRIYFRHKIARAGVPHTRHTATAKMHMHNVLKTAAGKAEKYDYLVYSHVHYHCVAGGAGWLAMTTPALQVTSNYGQRECDGEIDWGMVLITVDSKGVLSYAEITRPFHAPVAERHY